MAVHVTQDALTEIYIRLDDITLQKFVYSTRLWHETTQILQQPLFWKRRAEWLAGQPLNDYPNSSWRDIFHAVSELIPWMKANPQPSARAFGSVYMCYIDELPILRTLHDIGRPQKPYAIEFNLDAHILKQIRKPEVLQYLLDDGYITYDSYTARCHLQLTESGEIAEILLQFAPDDPLLDSAFAKIASDGRASVVTSLLSKREPSKDTIETMLRVAMTRRSTETVNAIIHCGRDADVISRRFNYSYIFLLYECLLPWLNRDEDEHSHVLPLIQLIERVHGWFKEDLNRVFDACVRGEKWTYVGLLLELHPELQNKSDCHASAIADEIETLGLDSREWFEGSSDGVLD